MRSTVSAPGSTTYRAARLGGLVVVTLVAFALALYTRQLSNLPPLALPDLVAFEFDAYSIGLAVQELAVPVVLIYIFSTTALFRRIINGEAIPGDALKLFGVLAIIQLLSAAYVLSLSIFTNDQITFRFLIVIIGGWLGGWRVGLGLGLIAMFINGSEDFIFFPETELFTAYQTRGLGILFDPVLGSVLLWYYLLNPSAFSAVWVGLVGGWGADLLAGRRFTPVTALGLGVGINFLGGYLVATAWDEPALLVSFLLPSAAVTGVAIGAIVLIARSVQAGAARRKAEAAELALARAELRALRAQINPHFLFNALNTIRYFVRTEPKTARRLLSDLSEVFQRALHAGEFVPLRDEISYVEAYLALEQARLEERLQVTWSIQAETALDRLLPTLVLQPVVENAVLHGVARKPGGGTICISIEAASDDLLLQVEDDGPGIDPARLAEILDPARANSTSIGLHNIDGRLRALYGEAYRLAIESEVGRGTCVEIRIPGGD